LFSDITFFPKIYLSRHFSSTTLQSDETRDAEAEVAGVAVEDDPEAEPVDPEADEDEVVEVHAAEEEVAREDKIEACSIPIVIPSSFLSEIFFLSLLYKNLFLLANERKYSFTI